MRRLWEFVVVVFLYIVILGLRLLAALTSALCEHETHGEGGAGGSRRQTQEVFSSTEQWSDPKVLQNRLRGQTAAGLKRHYG